MVLSPEEDDEDGPLSVPPPGDPDGDAPIVHEEDEADPAAGSSPAAGALVDVADLADLEGPAPSVPPPWEEAPDLASSDDDGEVLALLVAADDETPFDRDDDHDDDIDLPLATRPEDLFDEPFDPEGDD